MGAPLAWPARRAAGLGYPSRPPAPEPDLSSAPALLCLSTCPDDATARRIAEALVDQGLAACVNVLPGVHSVYRWQGRVEREDEVLLLAKTTPQAFAALRDGLVALHPYDLPEVVAVDITDGLPAYLAWIASQAGSAAARSLDPA